MNQSVLTAFDRDYQAVSNDLVLISQLVGAAIEQAMQALMVRDVILAQQVIDQDDQINKLRFKVEEECLTLIATRQPIAGDLRCVIAALHIIDEIERMGDHAAGIAKTVLLMKEEPLVKVIKKIPRMAELSRQMLADCIQAFQTRDAAWAQQIAAQDAEMDQMYKDVFDKLVEIMGEKKGMVTRATYMMWCAHNLERIADRVTNIAERVIFMTTGDLRELNV